MYTAFRKFQREIGTGKGWYTGLAVSSLLGQLHLRWLIDLVSLETYTKGAFLFFLSNNFFPGFDGFVSGGKLIKEVSEEKNKLKWCHEWNRRISMSVGEGWALWYKAEQIQYQRRNSTTLENAVKPIQGILISKDLPQTVHFTCNFFVVHWWHHEMVLFVAP